MNEECQLDPRWYGAVIGKEDWHFHRRLMKRYRIVLAPGEFSKLKAEIRDGAAQVVKRKSNTDTIYVFKIVRANQPVFVVARGMGLKTVLPPNKKLWRLRKSHNSTL